MIAMLNILLIFALTITNCHAKSGNTYLKRSPVGDASFLADSSAIGIGDSPSSIGLILFQMKRIKCIIPKCKNPQHVIHKGYCNKHYQRWNTYGDNILKIDKERFKKHVNKNEKMCTVCKTVKNKTEFYRSKIKKDGLISRCKACNRRAKYVDETKYELKECKLCNQLFLGNRGLCTHLCIIHELTPQQYYDKCIKKKYEGVCLNCGNPTNFKKLAYGYHSFCSTSCSNGNEEALNRKRATLLKKYGVDWYSKTEKCKNILRRKMSIRMKDKNMPGWLLYNPLACIIIDMYGFHYGYDFIHALNNNEKEFSIAGYFVDGYDANKNTVIEFYEKFHEYPAKKILDRIRRNAILKELDCKFIVIYESGKILCYENRKKMIRLA